MSTKLVDSRLFLNVNGGATLAQSFDAKLDKGANTVKLETLGKDVNPGDIDLIEDVKKGTQPGQLTLEQARVKKSKGGELTVRAEKAGESHFTVTAGLNAAVTIKHRLSITPEGVAEWSSRAQIANSGKTPIDNANLTITAGDTQNRGFQPKFAARAAMYESVSDSSTSQASSSVYRFDHPQKLSLKAGESVQVNLFNKDFALGAVEKKNTFTGYGADLYGKNSTVVEAGPVQTSYDVQNSTANGLGKILPRGDVQIVRPDGTLLSNTNINDTSIGKTMSLDGGRAFDLETTRKQTSHEIKDSRSLGPNQGKMLRVEVGQELTFKNCGSVDEPLNFNDAIQASQDDGKPAKVSAVKIDGVDLASNQWSYDTDKGVLSVPGLTLKANKDIKVSYVVETSVQG